MVTPHRDDHSIDHDRFADVIEFLIDKSIQRLIVAGTTGEYYAQSAAERFDLMKRAKNIIGKRLP